MDLSRYRKAVTAIVGAITATIPILWDLKITEVEAVMLVTVWATAFGVYGVPNDAPVGEPADPNVSERG